jgi:uncharacterized protein involved in exopolysaccharide biosynthesis
MENKNKNTFENSTIDFFLFLWKWRKFLIFIGLTAAVGSAIVSFMIKPTYKASATIFPIINFTTSKYLVDESFVESLSTFGDEDDLDKLLQIAQSSEIKKMLVSKFNLYKHWKINENDPYKETWLNLKYQEMISFGRTELLSLKIEVFDYDKDTVALIANAIPDFIDSVKNQISKQTAQKAFNYAKEEYDKLDLEVGLLEDSMQKIRELGVLDYLVELEAYSKGNAKALAAGSGSTKINEKLELLKKYGGVNYTLNDNFIKSKSRLFHYKKKLQEAEINLNKHFPASYRVEKAVPAQKKAKPVRWLMVTTTTIASLFFAVVVLLLFDKIKQIRKERNL